MRIDPPETKRAHRRPPRHIHCAPPPRLRRRQNLKRTLRQWNLLRRPREIRHRRQRFMAHRQQHLDQPRRARAREQMPDIRLHRAQRTLARAPLRAAPQPPQTLELHRVPDRRARRVTLDQIHAFRRPARLRVCHPHRAQLPLRTRREQIALDVIRQPDAANHPVNVIARRLRVREPFQHQHPRAFADDQPVALRIERRAPARRRQRAQLRKTHLRVQRIRPRQTARQHRIRAPRQQFIARQLDCIQRRRTRRIQRECPAAQPQRPRQHPRRQARDVAVQRPNAQLVRASRRSCATLFRKQLRLERRQQHLLGKRRHTLRRQRNVPDDHAHPLPIHRLRFRIAPRLPPRVEQQMKHRVQTPQQIRRQIQPRRIQRKAFDEARARRVNLVRHRPSRIEHLLGTQTPPPRRHLARRVPRRAQILPKRLQRRRAGKNPAQPHDRDGLVKLHRELRIGKL